MTLHWIKRCTCGELLRKTELSKKVSCPACNQVWQEVGISKIEISKINCPEGVQEGAR